MLNLTYNTECNNLHVPQQQTREWVEQKTKNIKKNKKNINDWIVWLADNWSLNTNQDAHKHKGHRLLFSV